MAKNYMDNNWMAEAKKPRPVHCYNIYTGEDHGVRLMNEAELAQFKAVTVRVQPAFVKAPQVTPPTEMEDAQRPGFGKW